MLQPFKPFKPFKPFDQLKGKAKAEVLDKVMTTLYSTQNQDGVAQLVLYYYEADAENGEFFPAVDNVDYLTEIINSILYIINNPNIMPLMHKALYNPGPSDFKFTV